MAYNSNYNNQSNQRDDSNEGGLREFVEHLRGSRYGLETMCIGGGQGLAAVYERLG